MAVSQKELPSLEACLFGDGGKCPKIVAAPSKQGKSVFDKKKGPSLDAFLESNSNDTTDNENADLPHRGQQPSQAAHDIDLAVLRKLASSQGLEDEGGSWRAIVWRILLGYLPPQDIHQSWKETVPPQRHLYRTLVDQYLYKTVDVNDDHDNDEDENTIHSVNHSTLDSGRELRGQLSKTLNRNRNLRKNYNRVSQLDDSMNDDLSERDASEHDHDDDDDGATVMSEWTMQVPVTTTPSSGTPKAASASFLRSSAARRRSSSQMTASQRIHRQLPAKYQELWKQAGIVLDKSESAAALGLNQLRLPQELLDMKRNEMQQRSEDGDNDNSDHAAIPEDDASDQAIPDDDASDQAVPADDDSDQAAIPVSNHNNKNDHNNEDSSDEHPSEHVDKLFQEFLQDAKTLSEIRKDVVRTHTDLRFYLEPQDNLGLRRPAAMERILFVWAKLNKGVRYVQGMNEIAATLYYVLANDLNVDFAVYAEADTYYLFHTLMSGKDMMRDVFVADLDDSSCGIQGRIANMQGLLERHDPELYLHLNEIGMDPSFYAIRWLTTLLSREFLLPDTIRLWDSMFSSTHKENFLRYACGTMVINVRDRLLKGDFSECLRLLQSYPPTNVDDILDSSRALWIYESQITLACHRGGITLNQALHHIQPPHGIIMAFGLKGGVAPSLTDQIEDAANIVKEQVEQTTTGLFWRAKRFLRKESGSSTDGAAAEAATETADATEEKPEPEVKRTPEPEPKQRSSLPRDAIDDLLGDSDDDEEPLKTSKEEETKLETAQAHVASIRKKLWTAWGKRGSASKSTPPMEPVVEKGAEEEAENVPQPKRTPII